MTLFQQLRRMSDDMRANWHADDRRVEMRAWSLHIQGKLTVNGEERHCRISDISASGLRIETDEMPLPGQRVWIEARGLAAVPAVVMWREGPRAGLSFESVQDLSEVLTIRRNDPANRARSPRFRLNCPRFTPALHAFLEGPHGASRLEVVDLSLGGVKLRGKTEAKAGSEGWIELSGHGQGAAGGVRWRKANFLGFDFAKPLSGESLFSLLAGKEYALSL